MRLPFLTEWNIVLYLLYVINYGLNNMQEVMGRPFKIWRLLFVYERRHQTTCFVAEDWGW